MSDDRQRKAQAGRQVLDMTTGSIPRHLVVFSLPMLAGTLLQTMYGVINAFWVGQYLGPPALAAVTVSSPILFITIAGASGLTLATNILIAQDVGAHLLDRVKGVVNTSLTIVVSLSIILMLLALHFLDALLHLLNVPADIYPMAKGYLQISLWSLPLYFSIFLIGAMLRGIGDSRTPVCFQIVSVVINAVLDPLLMLGWFGFPRLGINGTAWATIIAQAIAVVALFIYVAHARPLVWPDWREKWLDPLLAWLLIQIGFPAAIQQSVVSVSMLGIVRFVSAYGTNADAAYGAALRIDSVSFLPAVIIGQAVSTLAGQNIGAQRYDRVREIFWWGLLLSGVISLLITLVVMATPTTFLRIFVKQPQVLAIGVGYLHIVSLTYILFSVMFVSNGIINGAGQTIVTTLISIAALWFVRLPLAAALSDDLHSVTGIWYGMTLSVAVGMVMSLLYYASGHWQRCLVKVDAAGTRIDCDEEA